jgi:hypothetical protein
MDNTDGHIWQRGRPYLTVMLGTIYCKSTIYHNGQYTSSQGRRQELTRRRAGILDTVHCLRYANVSGTEPWTR